MPTPAADSEDVTIPTSGSTSGRPFLALFRAGRNSLHPKLTARLHEQNFDYALSWYAEDDPGDLGMAEGAAFVHRVAGQKWPGLLATLTEYREIIEAYDYVWLPDDDLFCEPETVSEFFRITSDLALDLAQPALTADSGFVHPIVLHHEAFQVRFTNFVELMCPALSRDMLWRSLPTMADTLSGWGVDAVWPRLTRVGKVAIIDTTTIKHTRPILGGDGYRTNQETGRSMLAEEMLSFERYGVQRFNRPHLNLGGLLQDGSTVSLGGTAVSPQFMVKHVIESAVRLPIEPIKLARYLGDHADHVQLESHPFLPSALNEALNSTGITFAEGV